MDYPQTFTSVRDTHSNYKDAVEAYSQHLSEIYSFDRATAETSGPITRATWITYQTEGVSFTGLNLALLLVGHLSINEKINLHPFYTFHPSSVEGQFGRTLCSGLAEATGLILGLTSIVLTIASICCFVFPVPLMWLWKVVMLLAGIIVFFIARIVLRTARLLKIPPSMFRDSTSPFRLHSITQIQRSEEKSERLAPENGRNGHL